MTQRTSIHGLHVATPLYNFIEEQGFLGRL